MLIDPHECKFCVHCAKLFERPKGVSPDEFRREYRCCSAACRFRHRQIQGMRRAAAAGWDARDLCDPDIIG